MEKVKVTKEVAEAIDEIIKRNDGNKAYAIVGFTKRPFRDKKLTPLNAITDDEGVQAIYFGCEVEKTPEEKVREYFESLVAQEDAHERIYESGAQFRQGWQSVGHTLDLLGIKIEGVNA